MRKRVIISLVLAVLISPGLYYTYVYLGGSFGGGGGGGGGAPCGFNKQMQNCNNYIISNVVCMEQVVEVGAVLLVVLIHNANIIIVAFLVVHLVVRLLVLL